MCIMLVFSSLSPAGVVVATVRWQVKTAWERLLRSFMPVAATRLLSMPRFRSFIASGTAPASHHAEVKASWHWKYLEVGAVFLAPQEAYK